MFSLQIRWLTVGFALLIGTPSGFAAEKSGAALPPVKDKVVLTVMGNIKTMNKDKTAQFDMAGLESLGMVKFKTDTPWYKEKTEFEGVPLKKLLAAVGATGDKITMTALNDYVVQMPLADTEKYNVIVAVKRNGKYMPISDKGPLFVVYEFDSSKELQQKMYYSRSAWQLAKIEVK